MASQTPADGVGPGVATSESHDLADGASIITRANTLQPEVPVNETVVVGYIPTPEGSAALAGAKGEAAIRGAELVVVNTGKHGSYGKAKVATPQDLEAIDAELAAAGIDHDVIQPTSGLAAADELLRVAVDRKASLLVIGLRRRTPVGKLILGSTAQQVLLDAPCAVLAVKPAPTG